MSGAKCTFASVVSGQWSVVPQQFAICNLQFAICILFLAATAHGQQPQPFVASADARPIGEAADNAPLRWKAKNVGVAQSAESLPAVPIHAAAPDNYTTTYTSRPGWNITRVDPSVRPAQAIGDPFSDPFGDRQAAAHQEPPLLLQPTQAEAAIEELPPPKTAGPEMQPQRLAAPSNPLVSTRQEPPPPPSSMPFAPEPPLASPFGGEPVVGTPCDQIYNDRNCCDVLANCRDFRNRLLADTIRNISLDITPRYNPDLTPEEDLADRTDKLPREIRTWKNRTGQVIATGSLADLTNNTVHVADESGREIARVPILELGEDELCYLNAWWRLPSECSIGYMQLARRDWIPSTFSWTASALCHKPLYFEEVQLERYGHTAGPLRQPIISSAHFFLNIAALPYKMGINPPHECQYALGYYRPGSCAPWMIPPIPLSLRGAVAETGAVLGGVFLLP